MRKFTAGLLIFIAGWSLGRYAPHWGSEPIQPVQTITPSRLKFVSPEKELLSVAPVMAARDADIALLLQQNDYETVLERYELLQDQADDEALADARVQILSHTRGLIAERNFSLAEQLLQPFLVIAYHDVEARVLLGAAYQGQGDLHAAIDQLYEARGYAYRPAMLQRITVRIRSMVAELTQSLKRNGDPSIVLALYQHLIQLEPDHAPYFMELATSQLALDDKEAAQRSLLLISQDPAVGAQAQAMLSELSVALAETQDTESWRTVTDVAGIPLHRSGNNFMVDARPANGQRIRLLLDTGASLTILTPDVLEQRGIRYKDTGRTSVFSTANGLVRAPIYTLESLVVGDWRVSNLDVGVLTLGGGGGSSIDGLLGMNFLNHFQFFIDQNQALLRLSIN